MSGMSGNVYNPQSRVKHSNVSGALAGAVSGAVTQAIQSHVGAKQHARMVEATKGLMTHHHLLNEQAEASRHTRGMEAASHFASLGGEVSNIETSAGKVSFFKKNDNENTGQPAPESTGASTPADGTPNVPVPSRIKDRQAFAGPGSLAPAKAPQANPWDTANQRAENLSRMSKPNIGQPKAAAKFSAATANLSSAASARKITPQEHAEGFASALASRVQGMGKPKK